MAQLIEMRKAMIDRLDTDHSIENLARINRVAVKLGDNGHREIAQNLLESALRIFEMRYPSDTFTISILLLNLGLQLDRRRKYDDARTVYERAIAAREDAVGPDSPTLWFPLYLLGNLRAKADHSESDRIAARKILERACPLVEKSTDAEPSSMADCLISLAATYEHITWGDDQDTRIHLIKKALGIYEKSCGASSLKVASAFCSLAIASIPGDAQEVVGYICRAIDIYESASEFDSVKARFRNLFQEADLFGYDSAGTLRKRLDAIDRDILEGI